jgi:hypothetical protein
MIDTQSRGEKIGIEYLMFDALHFLSEKEKALHFLRGAGQKEA